MSRYAVDASVWLYVEAKDREDAFGIAHQQLADLVENFEIVNVEYQSGTGWDWKE